MESESNLVLVVPLAGGNDLVGRMSLQEVVHEECIYPYSRKKRAPASPKIPAYIAFRYGGRLRAIHHVEGCASVTDAGVFAPKAAGAKDSRNTIFLRLGKGFSPNRIVPDGDIWPKGELWCALDTLFTCKTIEEANKTTQERGRKKGDCR